MGIMLYEKYISRWCIAYTHPLINDVLQKWEENDESSYVRVSALCWDTLRLYVYCMNECYSLYMFFIGITNIMRCAIVGILWDLNGGQGLGFKSFNVQKN